MYQDTRTQRNIAKLNDELYEVHQIMTRNVQEVLGVGEKLDRKIFLFPFRITLGHFCNIEFCLNKCTMIIAEFYNHELGNCAFTILMHLFALHVLVKRGKKPCR